MDVKIKVFKRDDNRDFCLVQNLTMGELHFNRVIQLRNQLVIAAKNIGREENLSPVLIPTMAEDADEQIRPAHKVIDVKDQANEIICVTPLWYNVEKPEISYAQVQFFARKKEKKFQPIVYVIYKLEEFIFLLDVMASL